MRREEIALGAPLRGNKRSGRKRKNQIRSGDTKVLLRPDPDVFSTNSFFGQWETGPLKTLLNVDTWDLGDGSSEDDQEPFEAGYPGSWVMTVGGRIREPGSNFAPGSIPCVPAIARIQFGTGGVQQIVEVDAWKNVIGLPARTTRVSIGYTQIANRTGGIPGIANTYYDQVEFTGTIHRSLETGEAIPTRTYRVNWDAVPALTEVPIPPFAVSWLWLPQTPVNAGDNPITQAIIRSNPVGVSFGETIEQVIPDVVASMARMHCFRPLPAGASSIQLQADQQVNAGRLIYRIGL